MKSMIKIGKVIFEIVHLLAGAALLVLIAMETNFLLVIGVSALLFLLVFLLRRCRRTPSSATDKGEEMSISSEKERRRLLWGEV